MNGYDDPKYAEQVAALKQELDRLQEFYEDNSDMSEQPDDWKAKFRAVK